MDGGRLGQYLKIYYGVYRIHDTFVVPPHVYFARAGAVWGELFRL